MAVVKWILGPILLLPAAVVGIVIGLGAFLGLAFVIIDPLALGIAAAAVGGFATGCLAHLLARWFARDYRRWLSLP